jgi:hypothetical protein
VRVTHRFHPLFSQELEFVKRRKNYGNDDRVYVYDTAGELVSLPAGWTDVVAEDPFVVIAAGRAPFRTEDLLELATWSSGSARGGRLANHRASSRLRRDRHVNYAAGVRGYRSHLLSHRSVFPIPSDKVDDRSVCRHETAQILRHNYMDALEVQEAA